MKLPLLDEVHHSEAVLGVARNPSTSLPAVRKLMHADSGMAHRIANMRPQIPDDVAEALLGLAEQLPDPWLVLALDSDRVSPAMRRRLAADNLSPTLREGCVESARRALPSFDDPSVYVYDISLRTVERLVGSTGPTAWSALALHSEWRVRTALAWAFTGSSKDLAEDIHRALLTDPKPEVRAAACQAMLPPAPSDLHSQLIRDPATRAAVAAYIALTPELADELATDADLHVRISVAKNPALTASARDKLVANQHQPVLGAPGLPAEAFVHPVSGVRVDFVAMKHGLVLNSLTYNETTPEPLRAQLYAGLTAMDTVMLRGLGVPWLRALPLERALTYLDSPCDFLRCELARRNDLPAAAIARLDGDPDLEVRQIAALRPSAPGYLLERVVCESTARDAARWPSLLVRHANFPQSAFVRLASAPEAKIREIACYGPQLPSDLVARLAGDVDAKVRRAAAGHPRLSAEDAVRLLEDQDLNVVEAAAASPALPPAVIDHIVDSVDLSKVMTLGRAAFLQRAKGFDAGRAGSSPT